mmetsp:Transcript_42615/g.99880  ORF Transcript_42615/g.99880 Transcript_42615/m.99880 type:complete len:203 (+) Transcript_42615:354-962(+)
MSPPTHASSPRVRQSSSTADRKRSSHCWVRYESRCNCAPALGVYTFTSCKTVSRSPFASANFKFNTRPSRPASCSSSTLKGKQPHHRSAASLKGVRQRVHTPAYPLRSEEHDHAARHSLRSPGNASSSCASTSATCFVCNFVSWSISTDAPSPSLSTSCRRVSRASGLPSAPRSPATFQVATVRARLEAERVHGVSLRGITS